MTTTPLLRRRLLFCSLALTVNACAERSASKEVAADTSAAAQDVPAAAPAEAAPEEAPPAAAPRLAFREASYDHSAGEAFRVSATVYDGEGNELHEETVRYSFDRGGLAWMSAVDSGSACKDIPADDHHISLVALSGTPIIVCGEQKGAETTLHAEAMRGLSASTTIIVR
jgi:hypothetical protein